MCALGRATQATESSAERESANTWSVYGRAWRLKRHQKRSRHNTIANSSARNEFEPGPNAHPYVSTAGEAGGGRAGHMEKAPLPTPLSEHDPSVNATTATAKAMTLWILLF